MLLKLYIACKAYSWWRQRCLHVDRVVFLWLFGGNLCGFCNSKDSLCCGTLLGWWTSACTSHGELLRNQENTTLINHMRKENCLLGAWKYVKSTDIWPNCMKVIERELEPLVTSSACPLNVAANFTPRVSTSLIELSHSLIFYQLYLMEISKNWAPNFYAGPLEFWF